MINSLPEDLHDRLLKLYQKDPDDVKHKRYTKAGRYVFFGKDKLHLLEDDELFNVLRDEYVIKDLIFLLIDLLEYDKNVVITFVSGVINTL